jgi:hypothetical protein
MPPDQAHHEAIPADAMRHDFGLVSTGRISNQEEEVMKAIGIALESPCPARTCWFRFQGAGLVLKIVEHT